MTIHVHRGHTHVSHLAKHQHHRRQFLIAKKFQLKFAILLLSFVFFTALITSFIVYYAMMVQMGQKLANVYPQGMLLPILAKVNAHVIGLFLLVAPLIALLSILLSFRIAGPLYRINRSLRRIASGDFTGQISLRAQDEFKSLADSINHLANEVRMSVQIQKGHVDKALMELETIKKALEANPAYQAELREAFQRLNDEVIGLKNELNEYKL